MAKLTLYAATALALLAVAPQVQADPIERPTTAEEMTVLGPKASKWRPDPRLEQQYYDSLAARFGPQPQPLRPVDLNGGQDPLDKRTWIYNSATTPTAAHFFELSVTQRLPDYRAY